MTLREELQQIATKYGPQTMELDVCYRDLQPYIKVSLTKTGQEVYIPATHYAADQLKNHLPVAIENDRLVEKEAA